MPKINVARVISGPDVSALEQYDRPWYEDVGVVGKQLAAGLVVDLPRMVGQGLRRLGEDGSIADNLGRKIVESADARAESWEPPRYGSGVIADTLAKGARALGPATAVYGAALIPGVGQVAAPVLGASLYGLSAAQDTEDKLRLQGVPDDEARRAGYLTGALQGVGEGVATAVGLKALGLARGAAGKTMESFVKGQLDSRVLAPFAKSLGKNYATQVSTEVAQDLGTEAIERAYGAEPEDMARIAKESAQAAIGLTTLLGPLGFAGHARQARRARELDFALNSLDAPPELRATAIEVLKRDALRAGVPASDVEAWAQKQRLSVPGQETKDLLEQRPTDAELDAGALQTDLFGQPLADETSTAPEGAGTRDVVADYRELQDAIRRLDVGIRALRDSGGSSDQMRQLLEMRAMRDQLVEQRDALEEEYHRARLGLDGGARQRLLPLEVPNPRAKTVVEPRQPDLFGMPANGEGLVSWLPEAAAEEEAAAPDTKTRSLFADAPTALVPTMFNPAEAGQATGSRGALAGNIRSQIMQQLQGGGDATLATQLSLDLASRLGDLRGMLEVIDQRQQQVEKNLERLDRKVTGESSMSPEEYAGKRNALESKLKTVEAARALVDLYQRALTTAYAEEARAKAREGVVVGQAPVSRVTEQTMREKNEAAAAAEAKKRLAEALAETDRRVAEGHLSKTAAERLSILRDVLAQPTRSRVEARFRKALRSAGFTNLDITPQERAEIDRVTRRRADVRAATKVPPGLAATAGSLTPRASLDANPPANAEVVQQAPAKAEAVQQAPAKAEAVQQAPAKAEVVQRATVAQLVEMLDGSDAQYEAAMRELARRNASPQTKAKEQVELDKFVEANAKKAWFAKDWEAATKGEPLPSLDSDNPALIRGRGRAPARMSVDDVRAVVRAVTSRWRNAPEVIVVQSMQDPQVPDAVRNYDATTKATGATGDVEGFFYGGKVYIVADTVRTNTDVMRVLFHETLGHYGLRGVFGDRFKTILRTVAASRRKDVIAKAKAYGLNPDSQADLEIAAEEVLAELAQTKPSLTMVQRAVAAIRSWLRENVPGFAKLKLSDAELIRDYILPAQKYVETVSKARSAPSPRGDAKPAAPGADSARFSRVPTRASVEKNLTKLPEPLRGPVRTATMAVRDISERVLDRTVFLHTLIDRAVKSGLKSAKQYAELHGRMEAETRALEREVERVADLYAYVEDKDRGNHARSANEFIYTATKTGKWWRGENADPELRAWFDELGPNAQKFVEAVFAHGQKVLSVKKAAVLEWATSEYDPLIENAKRKLQEAATPEQKAELQRGLEELLADKQQALKDFQSLFAIREGMPYAPIKRFGPWAVVAKSEEYIDAEARNDPDRIRELEQDEAHYYVDFVDTKGEARRLADKLAASGAYATDGGVTFFEREQNEADLYGSRDMLGALARLRSRINDSTDNPVRTQMRKLVADMWLVELAERSARKSEMRRRGISGDIDMLRSFAAQGRADARFIASVKYNPQIEDVVQRMRQEVRYGGDRARKSEIFNEIMRRRVAAMDVTHNPSVDKLLRLTSIYFLATSPAYYLQNLTQPFMMSVPYMAARHEYAKIANELVRAYKEITPVVKSGKLLETGLDYDLVPKDVKEAIQELVNRGRIDIGLETELGEFQIDGGSKFSKTWNKIDKGLRLLVQKGEAINRLSTAIAAYRLELARTGNAEAAIDYADTVLRDTHGDYGRFNAPTAFNSQFGRVALQFRKFQLIQLTYYMSLLKTVFTDPKERWAAARVLAFSLGHTAALGGVVGLPGYAAVALVAQGLANLFGDDDEPYDLTYNLREIIGDETLANLILRGAPTLAGVDLSGKVGAGQMLSIQPFSDADLSTSRGRAEYLGTLVGGASFGLVNRLADGFGLMMDGDWLRGLERVLPKGLSDAVKAYREADQGITKRSGEVLIAPEEVSLWDSMVKALGLPPVTNNVLYERQDRLRAVEDRLTERSREIKRAYITARKNGDTAKAREAVDQWSKLQATRARLGYKKQPWSELYRAKREADRRERQKVNGIGYNSGNRAYVERMASM